MNEENQEKNNRDNNRHYYGRIFPGIWLIAVGVLFLLNNFGYLQGQAWGKLWPVFIIIPGLLMLFRSHRRG